ncbi:PhoD-like phosphatase-domain-containing protein [Hyaloraphidium curvatum]|nr:PhoD-like phosphatase-domain-containing protein [Hyaloraphidium curvatum]
MAPKSWIVRARWFLSILSGLSLVLSWIELRVLDFRLAMPLQFALHAVLLPLALAVFWNRNRGQKALEDESAGSNPDSNATGLAKGVEVRDASGLRLRRPAAAGTAGGRDSSEITKLANGSRATPRPVAVWPHILVWLASAAVLAFIGYTVFHPWFYDRQEALQYFRLGHIGATSATLAVRYFANATLTAEYRRADEPAFHRGPGVVLGAAADYTGRVELANLAPDSEYLVRFVLDTTGEPVAFEGQGIEFRLRTLRPPGTNGRYVVMFGSCVTPGWPWPEKGIPGFRLALKEAPAGAYLLFLGDLIHADTPFWFGPSVEAYSYHYMRLLAHREAKELLSSFPSVYAYDDHEILNDWTGMESEPFAAANEAFVRYAGGTNPSTFGPPGDVNYFSFDIGDVAVFSLDTRRYRDPAAGAMLGEEQFRALEEWLLRTNSTHTFRAVLSSVPVSVNWRYRHDTWHCCMRDRERLLSFVRDNGIRNVVLLSGDRHIVGITRFPTYSPEMIEYSVSPISSFHLPDVYTKDRGESDEPVYSTSHSDTNWGYLAFDSSDPARPRIEFKLLDPDGAAFEHDVFVVPVSKGRPKKREPTADEADREGLARVFERGSESGDTVLNFA